MKTVSNLEDQRSGLVGTVAYSAPEQLEGDGYQGRITGQADMYSAGLVLLELMCVFLTQHERIAAFTDLRKENPCVPKELQKKVPHVAKLILALTDPSPS